MNNSLRGQFLIANKHLKNTNFYKTVVLIVEHGDDGAMGVVVNRPSSVKVAHALAEHFDLPDDDNVVYLGGPVEPGALFILHNAPQLDENEKPVVPGLYVASSAEIFENIVQAAAGGEVGLNYRVFCGCAGWAPGQLEGELAGAIGICIPPTPARCSMSIPTSFGTSRSRTSTKPTVSCPARPATPNGTDLGTQAAGLPADRRQARRLE